MTVASELLRRPTASLPIVLSVTALAMVVGYVALFGTTPGPEPHDEGAPARLFQLLMTAQALAIILFAARWMPKAPRQTGAIIALQLLFAAVPIAAIVFLES